MKGAKERLVEIIKYYKEARTDEGLADAIIKEFIRREDIETCDCLYTDLYNLIHIDEQCKSCNGLGWVANGMLFLKGGNSHARIIKIPKETARQTVHQTHR